MGVAKGVALGMAGMLYRPLKGLAIAAHATKNNSEAVVVASKRQYSIVKQCQKSGEVPNGAVLLVETTPDSDIVVKE